ncbi:hypothetical protein HO173_011115 [Letharia columbiana]|uniref:D-xylose 1-dehydrogenase (NADP(+), D-xylono-1,5-lactone-forming) n=1 Tax=Letharia columbiana TaxID=112416 RepID=A0A8H6L043_9LECA|nr:uncharacterized protein HO173_011115 [Letharia columbiana]KAF6230578.1 hypothetical protein HO173_011115 [Letharia columbiana]
MLAKVRFDIVYVSTPRPLHYLYIRTSLHNKRNVFLEKSVTVKREQYQKLVALAEEQDVVLLEAMWTRYLLGTKNFHEIISLKIGHVKRGFSDFPFPIAAPELPVSFCFLDKRVKDSACSQHLALGMQADVPMRVWLAQTLGLLSSTLELRRTCDGFVRGI